MAKKRKDTNSSATEAFKIGTMVGIQDKWPIPISSGSRIKPIGVVCGVVDTVNCKILISRIDHPDQMLNLFYNPQHFEDEDDISAVWSAEQAAAITASGSRNKSRAPKRKKGG